jgi:hypothetical protein
VERLAGGAVFVGVAFLLELKFGAPPDWATEMISQAEATKLQAWTKGVLMAKSLEALLGNH